MAAKMSVLGMMLSSYPYLRSAMVRFPLECLGMYWYCPVGLVTHRHFLVQIDKLLYTLKHFGNFFYFFPLKLVYLANFTTNGPNDFFYSKSKTFVPFVLRMVSYWH